MMKTILRRLAALTLLIIIVVLAITRLGRHGTMPGKVPLSPNEPVDLSVFQGLKPRTKVVFIGMDGATWNVIDTMIAGAQLPTFAHLKKEAAWCKLRSVPCYMSAPAWVSMMTGCYPEKTGIYSFAHLDSFTAEPRPISAADARVPSIWDIASEAGLKVAVISIPMTYPPRRVNGIMLSGFTTPGVTQVSEHSYTLAHLKSIAGDKFFKATGRRSHSPPKWAKVKFHRNTIMIYMYDSKDDGRQRYDSTCVVVRAEKGGQRGRPLVQRFYIPADSVTPWVRLNITPASQERSMVKWGWGRVKVRFKRRSSYVRVAAHPVYFSLEDTTVHFCYPEELREKLRKDLIRYFPDVVYIRTDIIDFLWDREEHLNYFYALDDWDLFMFEFQGPDKIEHEDAFGPYTREYYRRLDKILGRFLNRLGDNVVVFIASDHGFGGEDRYLVNMNRWFEQLGLLKRARDRKKIDRENTFVYHDQWNIYVNKRLLARRYHSISDFKVPEGKSVYEAFLDYLIAKGAEFQAPGVGKKMPLFFSRYKRPRQEPSPDLYYTPGEGYRDQVTSLSWWYQYGILIKLAKRKTWYHRRDGIFIAWGKGVKEGYDAGTKDIVDVAPTILYALGLPAASYFDGKAMRDVFNDQVSLSPPRCAYYDGLRIPQLGRRVIDRESMEEKMRSIGYVE